MTRNLDTQEESPVELRRRRVFRVRIWTAACGYLLASLALDQWGHGATPWRVLLTILPLAALASIVVIFAVRLRQMDEYQVKLFFPGLAVGFTATVFVALTLGTLNAAGITVSNAGWPIAIIGLLAWECTNVIVKAPTR